MPYEIRHETRDGVEKDCVYKKDGGALVGCTDRGKGEEYIAAMYANENKADDAPWWVTSKELREICESCGDNAVRMGLTAINLKAMPAQLLSSLCDKLGGADGFFTRCTETSFGEFDPGNKESFCAWLKHQCTGEWPGQKALADQSPLRLAIIISSNAYIDRQREIVRQKALEDYVESAWKGNMFVGSNPLLVWHGGDAIGDIVYADMEGPFLIEVAQERPDGPVNLAKRGEAPVMTTVKAVWDALENSDIDWGASHEFLYAVKDREDGVYDNILKLETSVLPRENAANGYTFFAVIGDNHD